MSEAVPVERRVMRRGGVWRVFALAGLSAFSLGLVIFPDLVVAGVFIRSPPRFGPAPLIGVGLPLVGAVVAVLFAARRYRRGR